jgi:hypothetical protein
VRGGDFPLAEVAVKIEWSVKTVEVSQLEVELTAYSLQDFEVLTVLPAGGGSHGTIVACKGREPKLVLEMPAPPMIENVTKPKRGKKS